MFRPMLLGMLLAGVTTLTGCGRDAPTTARDPRAPLTKEEWRQIPDDEVKYSRRTMERLKAGTASNKR